MSVDISIAVHQLLKQQVNITSLVGSNIFTDQLPQTAAGSSLVAWTITETANNHLQGALGLDQALIQIDAYGSSRPVANSIGWAVWTSLDNYSGVIAGVQIQAVSRATGVRSITDRVLAGSDQYRFIASQDLLFTYCSLNLVT